jgi:vacuolar-type H+-ATPase subunit F/Vma7
MVWVKRFRIKGDAGVKKDIVVVGGSRELVGFALAGVSETYSIETPDLADKLLEKESVIFITQEAEVKLADSLEKIKNKSIVQTIPGEGGYGRLKDIIRSTIGFELKR